MKILTFDVEEWFHILDHPTTENEKYWSNFEYRLEHNIENLLEILDKYNQKATFFCLGWLTKNHKNVIKKIDSLGYEIASHSMYHQLVYNQTNQEFEDDLRASIYSLEDITGKKIRIYRAPGFSVHEEDRWFFNILQKCGIEIDCSIFPAKRAHGGFEHFLYSTPSIIETNFSPIKEFPMNITNILGLKYVFSGGGYFRLTPLFLIDYFMKTSDYVMTYFHPHDFDKNKPILQDLSIFRKFKSQVGLKSAMEKLEYIIQNYNFVDIAQADKMIDWNNVHKINLKERRKYRRLE